MAVAITIAVGFLRGEKVFENSGDAVLLAAWKPRDGLEESSQTASGGLCPPRLGLTKQLLDGDAESVRHRCENFGTRNLPGSFPIADVGGLLVDLPCEFTHGETSS